MTHMAEKLIPPGGSTSGLTCNILNEPFKNVRRRYRLEEEIGRGEFGIIYSCTDVITGEQYACKSIRKSGLKTKLDVEDVQREVQVMERLKGHPAIIGIKATFEDEKVSDAFRREVQKIRDPLLLVIRFRSLCTPPRPSDRAMRKSRCF